ncbi:hypothetical protein PAPHI01_0820 [Pancytospora philotis]|nr:hypothetical protein PAPHI01_0820 [Pancytospora philotis]
MGAHTTPEMARAIEETRARIGTTHKLAVTALDGRTRTASYAYIRIIGRGSFGVVSEIRAGAESYALKTVHQNGRYIYRELDILRTLDHPHIVKLHGHYFSPAADGTHLNMVMEYLPICLQDAMGFWKKEELHLFGTIFTHLLRGLAYLHGLGIVHRDLKPANVFLTRDLCVKIGDFGSAKWVVAGERSTPYAGSRFYRAPENLMGLDDYGTKIDIWAAGIILCEARTPAQPFMADTAKGVMDAILRVIGDEDGYAARLGYALHSPAKAAGIAAYYKHCFEVPAVLDVIASILILDPAKRPTAAELLATDYSTAWKRANS